MTHKTRGIVLRTIKYGDTSLVATIFTNRLGVQTYLVSGVRTEKRSGSKAIMLQPGPYSTWKSTIIPKKIHATDKRILLGLFIRTYL